MPFKQIQLDIHPGMKDLFLFYFISHSKIQVNEKREIMTNKPDHFNNHCIDIIVKQNNYINTAHRHCQTLLKRVRLHNTNLCNGSFC